MTSSSDVSGAEFRYTGFVEAEVVARGHSVTVFDVTVTVDYYSETIDCCVLSLLDLSDFGVDSPTKWPTTSLALLLSTTSFKFEFRFIKY